jgi:uncharacterized protein YwgA
MAEASMDVGGLNRVDAYILALLRADGEAPLPGRVYLQKEMYLLQRAFPDLNADLDFEPYFLGPHSAILEDEADQLSRSELIAQVGSSISLTERGRRAAANAVLALSKEELDKIEEFKSLLNDLSNDELLAFIYFGYPDSEVERESSEYKRLSKDRKRIAVQLYERGKVSAERAAELAGTSFEDFLDGIPDLPG